MTISYGIVWREGGGPLARGKLELLGAAVRLEGVAGGDPVEREIPYAELAEVHVGRTGSERINGQSTLVLERTHGEPIMLAAAAQTWIVTELAQRLGELRGAA